MHENPEKHITSIYPPALQTTTKYSNQSEGRGWLSNWWRGGPTECEEESNDSWMMGNENRPTIDNQVQKLPAMSLRRVQRSPAAPRWWKCLQDGGGCCSPSVWWSGSANSAILSSISSACFNPSSVFSVPPFHFCWDLVANYLGDKFSGSNINRNLI